MIALPRSLDFIREKNLLQDLLMRSDLIQVYFRKMNPKAGWRMNWREETFTEGSLRSTSSRLRKVPHFSSVYLSITESAGRNSKPLCGLVRTVTDHQVWGGEVISKHLYFRMDLEQG